MATWLHSMEPGAFRAWARERRTAFVVLGVFLLAAGVTLLLNPQKGQEVEILSFPLLAAGALVVAYVLWPETGEAEAKPERETLATRLLRRLTLQGRLTPYFPLGGLLLVVAVVGYNAALASPLLTQDSLVLLFAAYLLAYRFVPPRFATERDFVFVFTLTLNLLLSLPLFLFRLVNFDFTQSVDVYSWALLAPQTSGLLNLFGVDTYVAACTEIPGLNPAACVGNHSPGLVFTPLNSPSPIALFITTACSGIYSVGIFASAFVAYMTTEYERLDWRVGVFLGLGIFAAYVANILRMTIIALVGYYSATPDPASLQPMLEAHSNAGWIIFLAWISLFWVLMFRFMRPARDARAPAPAKRGTRCALCGKVLTVAIPGSRCACGRLYHEACLAGAGSCPNCKRPYVRPSAA